MKWIAFSNSKVSVQLKKHESGVVYIFLAGQEDVIDDQSDFGLKVGALNKAIATGAEPSKQFVFNRANNAWYRPLGSLKISDLSAHFDDLFLTERDAGELEYRSRPNPRITQPGEKSNGNTRLSDSPTTVSPIKSDQFRDKDTNGRALDARPETNERVVRVGEADVQADLFGGGTGETGFRVGRQPNRLEPNEPKRDTGGTQANTRPPNTGRTLNEPARQAERVSAVDQSPTRTGSTGNWVTKQDSSGKPTLKERIAANIEAMSVLSAHSGGSFSLSDKEKLARYSGWGGMADEFVRGDLEAKLTPFVDDANLRNLKSSALYGYFTDDKLISSIWQLLKAAGFNGGNVAEPSCGTGRFISSRAQEFDDRQHFLAVEIDKTAAAITRALHPSATVFDSAFENVYESRLKKESFDLVIGNFPFGEQKIIDSDGDGYSIHNYFTFKSLDLLRPGGVMAVITSTHTLDGKNTDIRNRINEHAQLLGVVRMPSGTFNGTSVIADLLILRKRTGSASDLQFKELPFQNLAPMSVPAKRDFTTLVNNKTTSVSKGEDFAIHVNEVFTQQNPMVHMAGRASTGMIGLGSKPGLILDGDMQDVLAAIGQMALGTVKIFDNRNTYLEGGPPSVKQEFNLESTKPQYIGNLIERDGVIYVVSAYEQVSPQLWLLRGDEYRVNARGLRKPNGDKVDAIGVIKGYIALRDLAMSLLEEESKIEVDQPACDSLRAALNKSYDSFVKKHGYLNEKQNRKLFRRDALIGVGLSLEKWDRSLKVAEKADIFFKSLARSKTWQKEDYSLSEAVSISFSEKGKVDPQFVEELTGASLDELVKDSPGIVFKDPNTGAWEHKTSYLVGNVVEKLESARKRAETDSKFRQNVAALEKVQPPYVNCKDIGVSFGSAWLPSELIENYIRSVYKANGVDVTVALSRGSAESAPQLKISIRSGSTASYGIVTKSSHGTEQCPFSRIVEALMASTPLVVRVETKQGSKVDYEATITANNKMESVRDDFARWIVSDEKRSQQVEAIYNSKINVYNYEMDYSDIDYDFKGLNPLWEPRTHQKEFVLSAIIRGNMLNADCVGAGKTGMQVMLAHEQKRLKLAQLPAIIVPNHMLYQTAAEAQTMYPSARICIVTKEDLSRENRSAFISKIAMNEWDFVVITYSMFQQLMPNSEYLAEKLRSQIATLENSLREAKGENDRLSSRNILLKLQQAESRLENLVGNVTNNRFPLELGHTKIDSLNYDEFHKLKNLGLNMVKSIPGISDSGSNIAFVEHVKMQYIMDTYYNGEERGITAYTATPISNSIAELYTIFRMLKPSLLAQESIANFNDWAAQYGEIKTALEVLPEGKGFQMKARLSTFKNLPELLAAFRTFTQIHTREELNLPVPEYSEHTVTAEANRWQQYIFDTLVERATKLRNKEVDSDIDNFLAIVNDAAMAAISHQALYPTANLPSQHSKLDLCVSNVTRIFFETEENKSTQLIFLDRSVPKANTWNAYEYIRNQLIRNGISADQIAFIHDADTDEKRFDLYDKLNNGEKRVCIGSTEKLGTGTNAQAKLIALHDVDIPWTPKELEQRLGRGVRTGNSNIHIDIFRYTTKGSFDVFRLETIKRKAVAISAAMSAPRLAERRFEEDTEIDYDTLIAETSDNPVVKEKARVDATIAALQRKADDFENEKHSLRRKVASFKRTINDKQPRYEELKAAYERILKAVRESPKVEIPEGISEYKKKALEMYGRLAQAKVTTFGVIDGVQDGDTTWVEIDALKKALDAVLDQSLADGRPRKITAYGECAGLRRVARGIRDSTSSSDEIRYYDPETTDAEGAYFLFASYSWYIHTNEQTSIAFRGVLNYLVSDLIDDYRHADRTLSDAKLALENLKGFDFDAEFPEREKLTAAYARRAKIEAEIIELMASKSAEEENKQVLPMPMMIATYRERGCPADFDPYSVTAGQDREEEELSVIDLPLDQGRVIDVSLSPS